MPLGWKVSNTCQVPHADDGVASKGKESYLLVQVRPSAGMLPCRQAHTPNTHRKEGRAMGWYSVG